MLIYLLRHGQTEYNAQKRYQGQRDIPLSPEGAAQLRRADFDPDVVYVSTLQRTSQTARILFPEAKLVPVDGLKEMCFGSFEGRNFIEMEKDPEYQAWVKANCESPCPDGERKTDFSDRICRTVAELIDKALAAGEERLVILAHGGPHPSRRREVGQADPRQGHRHRVRPAKERMMADFPVHFATAATRLLGTRLPIVAGGLMWLSDARYVAAASAGLPGLVAGLARRG